LAGLLYNAAGRNISSDKKAMAEEYQRTSDKDKGSVREQLRFLNSQPSLGRRFFQDFIEARLVVNNGGEQW
jgi:hypothetical protein